MRLSRWALSLVSLHVCAVAGDYLVGTYPPPFDLTSNKSLVAAAWKNLSLTLDNYLEGKTNGELDFILAAQNISFSLGMFSLHDPDAIKLQYHHTSLETKNAKNGTHKVDANSIYRVESVSKLITTMVGMVSLTEDQWHRPVTEINPAFKHLVGVNASDPVWATLWDEVTPHALASQLSGISTVGLPVDDLYNAALSKMYGAPLINVTAYTSCAHELFCPAQQAIATVNKLPPNFQTWSTPAYSDLNFMLLGIVMSNLTKKELPNLYRKALFEPLGMDSTFYTHPTDQVDIDRAVIVNWAIFTGDPITTNPSGGIQSTTSDLQKMGVGILNNTLLSAARTRKWMKPVSQTPSLTYAVGAPWEIHRFVHPGTSKVTDLYTKLGDDDENGAAMIIIPQYDAGFVMLNAATAADRMTMMMRILDQLDNTMVPALEAEALAQASRNLIGTYKSTNPDIDASVTIAYNKSSSISVNSDLQVTNWTYNGTDVIAGPFFKGSRLRLEQSIPNPAGKEAGQVAFQLSDLVQQLTYLEAMKVPSLEVYGTWTGFVNSSEDFLDTESQAWGGVNTNLFIFNVDEGGRATSCTPAVDRITLKRVDDNCK